MHERRRIDQTEADVAGHARHQRNPRAHIVSRPLDASANSCFRRIPPGVGNAGPIAEENHIDAATLGDLCNLLVDADRRDRCVRSMIREPAISHRDACKRGQTPSGFCASLSCPFNKPRGRPHGVGLIVDASSLLGRHIRGSGRDELIGVEFARLKRSGDTTVLVEDFDCRFPICIGAPTQRLAHGVRCQPELP